MKILNLFAGIGGNWTTKCLIKPQLTLQGKQSHQLNLNQPEWMKGSIEGLMRQIPSFFRCTSFL